MNADSEVVVMEAIEETKDIAYKNFLVMSDTAWFRLVIVMWIVVMYSALPTDFWSGEPFNDNIEPVVVSSCVRETQAEGNEEELVRYWMQRLEQ